MLPKTFKELLASWISHDIVVINTASFHQTELTEGVALETYTAQIRAVESDYIEVSFQAQKKGKMQPVDQYIPFSRIRRASVWGEQRYLHL